MRTGPEAKSLQSSTTRSPATPGFAPQRPATPRSQNTSNTEPSALSRKIRSMLPHMQDQLEVSTPWETWSVTDSRRRVLRLLLHIVSTPRSTPNPKPD